MADKTGHADKPGAGPFDAQYVCSHELLTGYYTYENPSTGTYEAVKAMPAGTPDETAMGNFTSRSDAMRWIENNHKH